MRQTFFQILILGSVHCSFASEEKGMPSLQSFLEEDADFAVESEPKIAEKLNAEAALTQTDPTLSFTDQEDMHEVKEALQVLELEIVLEKTLVAAKFEEMDVVLREAPSEKREALLAEKIEEIQALAKRIDVLNEDRKNKLDSLNEMVSVPEEGFYYFSSHCEHMIAAKLSAAALAQAKPSPQPESQSETARKPEPDTTCSVCDQPYRIDVRHIEGGGVGYNQGYSTLDGYFSFQRGAAIPFIDLRGHVFNDGKWATNAGIGLRYLLNPLTTMIGGNLYYDYRKTNHYHYNQIGAGLEAFFSRWECYINGYLPVGKKRKTISHTFDGLSFNSFFENSILMDQNFTDKREFAMRGFDAEIGAHCLNACNQDLYIGAGPYYFNADGSKTTWGGKVRIKAKITKYFSLEVIDSFDHLFHNRLQGSIALSFPIGKQKSANRSLSKNLLCKIAQESPQRQEILVVNKAKKSFSTGPVVAVDPSTGQPYFVVFIDNTNTNPLLNGTIDNTSTNALPNGTFENPYPTAIGAQNNSVAGNVIYAFSGDGTTNGMDTGITLKDNQRFLGSAVSHGFNTTLGSLVVPPQTSTTPHISNPDGKVIELGNTHGTEVSGFNIAVSNAGSDMNPVMGIHGLGSTGLITITRNTITGEATGSTYTENRAIWLNNFQGDALIDGNTITNQGSNSIYVYKDEGNSDSLLTITNNVITSSFEAAIYLQNNSSSGNALKTVISGNQVTYSKDGFYADYSISLIQGIFSHNIFSNNTERGIGLTPNNGEHVAFQFIENHMDNNGTWGVRVHPGTFTTSTGSACVQFIDNVATGNGTTDYLLDGSEGPLSEEPPSGNIGNFSRIDVTSVPEGSCSF